MRWHMPSTFPHVRLALQSEKPRVTEGADGAQRVSVENCGSDVTSGAPSLPTVTCHVELPKGAKVTELKILGGEHVPLAGRYRIQAAGPCVHDEPVEEEERLRVRRQAIRTWSRKHDAVYASDAWYPPDPLTLCATWDTATCALALLQFNPVQYN